MRFGSMSRESGQPEALPLLVDALLREKRRYRRWQMGRWLIVGLVFFFVFFGAQQNTVQVPIVGSDHAAVIQIRGPILETAPSDPQYIIASLRQAFATPHAKGIVLRLNSGGGSPVAAHQVYQAIVRMREKHPKIPVYAVVSDICASACYYIAAAADEIHADPYSLVGSIGVVFDGLGFVDAMQKLGIERRALVAGENKGFLDPFSPVNPKHREFAQEMLNTMHAGFIADVKKSRAGKLPAEAGANDPLFSGLIWTGEQAEKLGLTDGFLTARQLAENKLKVQHLLDYSHRESLVDRLTAKGWGLNWGTWFGKQLAEHASPVVQAAWPFDVGATHVSSYRP